MPVNPLNTKPSIAIKTESHSNSTLSASTVARYRQAQIAHEVAKESAIRDLSSNPNLSAQEAANAIMQIQRLHQQSSQATLAVAEMCTTEIQESDASTMRAMRKEGATDAQIAEFYGTNQTKINRMINGT